MTFTEQLSATAEKSYLVERKNCIGTNSASYAYLERGFKEGARWCLQSELVREMELILKTRYSNDATPTGTAMDAQIDQALQKLTEARGEK